MIVSFFVFSRLQSPISIDLFGPSEEFRGSQPWVNVKITDYVIIIELENPWWDFGWGVAAVAA